MWCTVCKRINLLGRWLHCKPEAVGLSSERPGFAGCFKVSWCILKRYTVDAVFPFVSCSLCSIPTKAFLLCHTHTPTHTHTQTLMLATRPYNCPHRDPMTTYHHHMRHKENFIYAALSLSLSMFLIWLPLLMWLFSLLLGLFFPSTSCPWHFFYFPSLSLSSYAVFVLFFLSHPCSDIGSLGTGLVMCSRLPE